MGRYTIPRLGFAVVVGLATVLIYGIVLRSPDTHGNLWTGVHPGYNRTTIATMGASVVWEGPVGKIGFYHPQMTAATAKPADPARQAYLEAGCAMCHGIDARGGVVGPSLASADPSVVERMVRSGPGGMPVFAETQVSKADLGQISAYLQSVKPNNLSPEQVDALQQLTYDPSTPLATLLQGKSVIRQSCGACHEPPSKAQILGSFTSDYEAASLVTQMAQNAKLSFVDAKAVSAYVLAIINGADPVVVFSWARSPGSVSAASSEQPAAAGSVAGSQQAAGGAAAGQQLFQSNCALCHGANGAGGMSFGQVAAADLRWTALGPLYGNDATIVAQAVLDAKDEKGGDLDAVMPLWRGKLSEQDVASIVAYLQTLH